MIATIRDALLSFFLPSCCHLCGSLIETWNDGITCAACWSACEQHENIPAAPPASGLAYAAACGDYEGAWRETVLHLKRVPQLAPRVQPVLASIVSRSDIEFDCVIPIPLHPRRERQRGFNQATVIARSIGSWISLPVSEGCLIRVKATSPHRAGTTPRQRARSLKGAFKVRALRPIKDRNVLLVDDVTTTGATAREAAATILQAGAKAVGLVTIARVRQ